MTWNEITECVVELERVSSGASETVSETFAELIDHYIDMADFLKMFLDASPDQV